VAAGGSTAAASTRPYTPRHNGKVERYNRILADATRLHAGVTNVTASYS